MRYLERLVLGLWIVLECFAYLSFFCILFNSNFIYFRGRVLAKVYFVVYCCFCFYSSYLLNNHHYIIAFLVFFFGLPVGMLWLHRHIRDKNLKKQGLKKPTFYDDFKNDFSSLTIVAENFTKAFSISIAWNFKTIFNGARWLFSFKTLKVMWDILLLLLFYPFKQGLFFKKIIKAFYISIIWSFKVLFKTIWVMFKIIWSFIYSVLYGIKHGC